MVKVRVNGKMEVLACTLSEEVLKQPDREFLEDLIKSAVNQAIERVRLRVAEETTKMASELGLPPGIDLAGIGQLSDASEKRWKKSSTIRFDRPVRSVRPTGKGTETWPRAQWGDRPPDAGTGQVAGHRAENRRAADALSGRRRSRPSRVPGRCLAGHHRNGSSMPAMLQLDGRRTVWDLRRRTAGRLADLRGRAAARPGCPGADRDVSRAFITSFRGGWRRWKTWGRNS